MNVLRRLWAAEKAAWAAWKRAMRRPAGVELQVVPVESLAPDPAPAPVRRVTRPRRATVVASGAPHAPAEPPPWADPAFRFTVMGEGGPQGCDQAGEMKALQAAAGPGAQVWDRKLCAYRAGG